MSLQLMNGLIEHEMAVDLFESPQREKSKKEVINLIKTGITKKQIARQLGIAPLVLDNAIIRLGFQLIAEPSAEQPANQQWFVANNKIADKPVLKDSSLLENDVCMQ